MNKEFMWGVIFTLLGGTFWGLSGTAAQFIQEYRQVDAQWLVTTRLFIASFISLSFVYLRGREVLVKLFSNKKDLFGTFIFGVLGMALCQYAYFKSIFYAGAGIATVLQYLAPTLIILYYLIGKRKKPTPRELVSVVLALIGTILIATKGDFSFEQINDHALFWGLLSAVAIAIYSTQPVSLLKKYGSGPIVSVGMLFGAVMGFLVWFPFYIPGTWDGLTHGAYWTIILIGTVVSFNLYLEGVRRIGAVKGSILSSVEPISAALFSWAILGNTFNISESIGFFLILMTVLILATGKEKEESK